MGVNRNKNRFRKDLYWTVSHITPLVCAGPYWLALTGWPTFLSRKVMDKSEFAGLPVHLGLHCADWKLCGGGIMVWGSFFRTF